MATFKETFAAKRKELGAGKIFTWNGKSYTTDMASDKKSAPTAANKPKARPASPQSGASQSGTAGKVAPKAAPARPAGGGKAKQAAAMGAKSSNVASTAAKADRASTAKKNLAAQKSRSSMKKGMTLRERNGA